MQAGPGLERRCAGTGTAAQLTQVTECTDATDQTCLNPTTFAWPAEQIGFAPAVATGITPFAPAKSDDYPPDLNGDGRCLAADTDLMDSGTFFLAAMTPSVHRESCRAYYP